MSSPPAPAATAAPAKAPPGPAVVLDRAALARAPVDVLAGVVVLLAVVVGASVLLAAVVGIVALVVVGVIWLMARPERFLVATAAPAAFALGWIWLGAAHVTVSSLDALGVRCRRGAVYACLAGAPLLAPTVGPLAFLRSLGRGVAGRRVLALLAAVALVALGVVLGRATA